MNTQTKEDLLQAIKKGEIKFLKLTIGFRKNENLEAFLRYLKEMRGIPQLEASNPMEVEIVVPVTFYSQMIFMLSMAEQFKECSLEAVGYTPEEHVYQVKCIKDMHIPIVNVPAFEEGQTYTAVGRLGVLVATGETDDEVCLAVNKDNDWIKDDMFAKHFVLVAE